MKTLRRHLSYAGGVSYAAATISGNKLIKGTVGAGSLTTILGYRCLFYRVN